MRVEGNCDGVEIDAKRFYLPGVAILDVCPMCKVECETDLGTMYLSYPVIGDAQEIQLFCDDCEHYWPAHIVLSMTVALAPTNKA